MTTLHLESKYQTLIANTNNGFYLFDMYENNIRSGPHCEIYKPYLIKMLSPTHCLFVTQKSNNINDINLEIDMDENINAFPKSYTIMVFDVLMGKIILHFTIGHKILNILIEDKYILIVTVNQILVYSQNILTNNNDPNNVTFIKTIHTYSNPLGLCVVNCYKNILVIATLGRIIGEIMICTTSNKSETCKDVKDTNAKKNPNLYIQAHEHNITNISLDEKCELVSTTSESGTLMNVFDIPNCTKVYQFRRGIFSTTIHSIAFDNTSNYICCCSNNGTCHVFHLYDNICENNIDHKNTTSSFSMLGSVVSVCNSQWAYKLFKINSGIKTNCNFIKKDNMINIFITLDNLTYYIIEDIEKNIDKTISFDLNKFINKID